MEENKEENVVVPQEESKEEVVEAPKKGEEAKVEEPITEVSPEVASAE